MTLFEPFVIERGPLRDQPLGGRRHTFDVMFCICSRRYIMARLLSVKLGKKSQVHPHHRR